MTNNLISVLNELIRTSKDGEQGFRNAAENVTDQSLKTLFLEKAEGCQHAVHELQNHVSQMDATPEDSGSLLGALHRGWINIKSSLTNHDDYAVLSECERGEDAAKEVYAKVLKEDLPAEIRSIVQHQYEGVIENHNMIRDLRDKYAPAK